MNGSRLGALAASRRISSAVSFLYPVVRPPPAPKAENVQDFPLNRAFDFTDGAAWETYGFVRRPQNVRNFKTVHHLAALSAEPVFEERKQQLVAFFRFCRQLDAVLRDGKRPLVGFPDQPGNADALVFRDQLERFKIGIAVAVDIGVRPADAHAELFGKIGALRPEIAVARFVVEFIDAFVKRGHMILLPSSKKRAAGARFVAIGKRVWYAKENIRRNYGKPPIFGHGKARANSARRNGKALAFRKRVCKKHCARRFQGYVHKSRIGFSL